MNELVSPFARLWNWVTATGGFPGQVIFVSLVVCCIMAITVWFSNRR